jgi:phosphoenolpyruvate phosphomutase
LRVAANIMVVSIRTLLAQNKGLVRLCETHDISSAEIIKNTVGNDGQRFDGLWIGGLCQTTYLGIPDTELISPLQRAAFLNLNNNLQQRKTRHPLCAAFDADSGGEAADIPALVALLDLVGVSMIIIEDKAVSEPGQKVNSLKDTSSLQAQADMYEFANTIRTFKVAAINRDIMITARIESFTVRIERMDEAEERASVQSALRDALQRAEVYRDAGADAIMIHSKSRHPGEVLSFLTEYRSRDTVTPLVVVPTTYSETLQSVLYAAGANVIIYANHLMRAKISAASKISKQILAENPGLFSDDPELSACLEAQNFGCLLRKLWEKRYWGEETKESQMYRIIAATYAAENMRAVAKDLLNGEQSGCEADERIIPVKDLLKINARQIYGPEDLVL